MAFAVNTFSFSSSLADKLSLTEKKLDNHYPIFLTLVIILAFAIRFYIAFLSGLPWLSSDTYDYMNMANAILAGHPVAKFPNGYPLLIAIIKMVFNPAKANPTLILLNIILSTLIVWISAIITTTITKKRCLGILAALIICLYPNQINYTRLLLSEIPSCFLLTFSALIFLRKQYFLSGFLLFLASLFRSDLFLVFPLLFLSTIFFPYHEKKTIKGLYSLGGFLLAMFFYSFMLSGGIVASTNRDNLEILKSLNVNSITEKYPGIGNFSNSEKQHPIKTYIEFIWDHPETYLLQRLSALENMWGWSFSSDRGIAAKLLIAVRLPIFILGMIGFWKHRKNFNVWILVVPVLALTIVHVGAYSSPRYTLTVEPLLICLASIFFYKKANGIEKSSKNNLIM